MTSCVYNPMYCSPPGSSLHGISQARIQEWVAIFSSRGSSRFKYWASVSCLVGGFFTLSHQGSPVHIDTLVVFLRHLPYLHLHSAVWIPSLNDCTAGLVYATYMKLLSVYKNVSSYIALHAFRSIMTFNCPVTLCSNRDQVFMVPGTHHILSARIHVS